MAIVKILKSPPQSASDELGHVYRHGVDERDVYQKVRCKQEFGPNYEDEDDDCNNAQLWGSNDTAPDYLQSIGGYRK